MVRLDHVVQAYLRACRAPNASAKVAMKRISAGDICVNGIVTRQPKQQIVPGVEEVTLAATGEVLPQDDHEFYLMHKPAGCVCQRHPREKTVYDLIPSDAFREDLVCVGRLDRDTTGALLFGTDGGVQSMLLHPSSRVFKVYLAECTGTLASDAVERFRTGLALEDGTPCAPATLEILARREEDANEDATEGATEGGAIDTADGRTRVRVTLHEGFFHQVKRMLAQCGATVVALHRERFGSFEAAGLAPGGMRALSAAERASLCDLLPETRVADKFVEWRPDASAQHPSGKRPREADET